MKNFIITCIWIIASFVSVSAQSTRTVSGLVTDENSEPMIGVNVSVADIPGLGAITDINGRYIIKMEPYHKLVFSYIGYIPVEVLVKEQKTINVKMKESEATSIDEVVITGMGAQKKITVTGAVTNVDVEQLRSSPSSSMADALAGVAPGVMAMQTSGKPGATSDFWIRSISTFGASNEALVLVDGFERDLNEVNVEDVESFTVLKDASETAIYGSKGANGVILITTKRGKEGKININAKVEGFYGTLTKLPEFVDGYTYASLANEAKITRNQDPLFQPEHLEILRLGLDPDLYPDVDWMDILLRNGAWSKRATLNLRGGGKTARYFVSGGYYDQQGMYKVDKTMKDYNTNANYRKWTYRMNVDIDITKSTLLKVGISGALSKQNDPGNGSDNIWTALMGYNPITSPQVYSNGLLPSYGNEDQPGRYNPWVQATKTGYQENWTNNIQTNVSLEQKLDFITKGLRFVGRFGYDTNNSSSIKRYERPAMYRAKKQRNADGTLDFTEVTKATPDIEQSTSSGGSRRESFEWELHYNRGFKAHHVGGVLKYTQSSKVQTVGIGGDVKNGIARRNQGLAGRFNYNWNYRYFVNFNFGYTGSENFHKDHRFGFFPAVSGAWNLAEEPFMKKLKWVNMIKIRYSYGKTGNDNLGVRFPYLYTIKPIMTNANPPVATGGYQFADWGYNRYYGGMQYTDLASTDVSWEIATKKDLGIDFAFFNDRLTGSVDYFEEHRTGIYMRRNFLPWMVGIVPRPLGTETEDVRPSANVGEVSAKGFDGNFAFKHKIGKVDLTVRGNITYSKNEILERDEENTMYYYKMQEGHRVNQARGLVALGLFKDYEDIRNSPRQTFGDVQPGDIKYADINGDGLINTDDRVSIGATTKPNLTYGFGVSAKWKGLDVNVHFQGVGKSTFQINGSSVFMFSLGENFGNVLKEIAESNRWVLGVNEDPNAEYPRLTYGENKNNQQESTFWLRDGSYLRLKTLDIGYTLPKAWVNKAHLNTVRFFFIGTNLLTFSKFKLWDPEMGSSTGKAYPLSKTYSLGVSVNL